MEKLRSVSSGESRDATSVTKGSAPEGDQPRAPFKGEYPPLREETSWSDSKRWVKHGAGWAIARAGLHQRLLKDRAVIVLFHRVDDRLGPDGLTCSRREFRTWCEFFQQHMTVVSLTELLEKVRRGQDISCHAAITFDDGYRDNARNAAPILKEFGLPASFFVSTNFIDSNVVPWWDEKLPIRSEWMNWDDVRALADQGFEIGAHTMNHVDLGLADTDLANREIKGSLERLERELERPVPHFTYPYGRREQITSANLELVKQAGFVSCSSSYGGLVRPGDDLHRIKRTPISEWFLSPYQFLFEIIALADTP